MEMILQLLSSISSIAGSGWIGAILSVVAIVFCLLAYGFMEKLAREKAYKDSKEKEIQDQIENRKENGKIESSWESAIDRAKPTESGKKKR